MNNEIIELKYGGIYKITNIINNKVYIGQSLNPTNRLKAHKKAGILGYARKQDTPNILYIDMFNQGIDTFTFEIIEEINVNKFDYQRIINERECYYIELYNSLSPNGYNRQSGGSYGRIISEETRKKLSYASKGDKNPNYGKTGNKSPNYGYQPNIETRKKIGLRHKGKVLSEETKKKMSTSKKGIKHPLYLKTHSDTTKHKMSDSQKGTKNPMYGKTHSDTTKHKMSIIKTIKILQKIVNNEEISKPTIKKYKQYIDEFNLTGNIQYLEELL